MCQPWGSLQLDDRLKNTKYDFQELMDLNICVILIAGMWMESRWGACGRFIRSILERNRIFRYRYNEPQENQREGEEQNSGPSAPHHTHIQEGKGEQLVFARKMAREPSSLRQQVLAIPMEYMKEQEIRDATHSLHS